MIIYAIYMYHLHVNCPKYIEQIYWQKKMADSIDSIDLDDDDPSTTGSQVICHVCRRLVSLKRDGTFRVHGPRDRRCQGSSLLPA